MLMKKAINIFLLIATLALGSGIFLYYSFKGNKQEKKAITVQKTTSFYRRINNLSDFKEIQGSPLSGKFKDVWSVKLVYDTETDVLYYVHSQKFRYHYNFCAEILHYNEPLEVFNILNYGKNFGRRFYLASLNYYGQSKNYTLEFVSDDIINAEQITTLYKEVINTSYLTDSLKVLVSSDYLARLDQNSQLTLPRIYPSAIYSGQQYQLLQRGLTYGILRFSDNLKEDYSAINPGDILITKGTPSVVPVCAGIITDVFQTPLSHISVLCHNRKIPSAASLTIWNRKDLQKLNGLPVSLKVSEDSLQILAATYAELGNFRKNIPEPKRIALKGNPEAKNILRINDFGFRQRNEIGNKAAGLGELNKVAAKRSSKFVIPEGAFAIPFWFYKEHLQQPEINTLLMSIVATDSKDIKVLQEQLKKLRKLIKEAPLNPALLQQIKTIIVSNNVGNSYRFRSSSNAEDRDGFSGAGLYESKTGILNDTSKTIEKAIKAVWASAWNDEAFLERRAGNIDQRTVLMGVLAHRNFPDELSNGVAVTKNLYRKDFPGMTVNVQIGEVEVVAPPDGVVCEQFVCIPVSVTKFFSNDIAVDYLTYSSLTKGKRVLSMAQITLLYESLDKIKMHYFNNIEVGNKPEEYNDFGLDIEFKFDKNNKLYIKQVRPYY